MGREGGKVPFPWTWVVGLYSLMQGWVGGGEGLLVGMVQSL